MSYVNLKAILSDALVQGYAVGGFNFNSFEDLKGIAQAAHAKSAPVIVMASPNTTRYIGLNTVCKMIKGMAEDYNIPICLHLDHTTDIDFIFTCVNAGFSSVMIDASAKPYEENIELTKRVVDFARKYGCSVEAELGTITGREDQIGETIASFTNPEDVPRFVSETGVDALAIAVGTMHGFYKSEPQIDFARIKAIRMITHVPLVLHGGTGISEPDFQNAILCGISKINVGTEIKHAFSTTIRESTSVLGQEEDPRKYMSMVTQNCASVVQRKIEVFGSANRVFY